jgi:RNA polymerase sigma-70 factor (ECF subfamily)
VAVVVEDLELVARRAAAGDGPAFAALVRATQADVWRACCALVDRDAADDLTQETYLRAHRALRSYAGRSSVRTWLLGIARHVCADELRLRHRHRRSLRLLPPRAVGADPTGEVQLLLLLAQLPQERREAFVFTQLLGLSYDEAAAAAGCPVGTIRSRVARARDDLRAALIESRAADA